VTRVVRRLDGDHGREPAAAPRFGVVLLHRGGPASAEGIGADVDVDDDLRIAWQRLGDRSPALDLVASQARALENVLNGRDFAAHAEPGASRVVAAFGNGGPDAATALEALERAGVERVVALPLYPQDAGFLGGSCIDTLLAAARARRFAPGIETIRSFHEDPAWRELLVARTRAAFDLLPPDLRGGAPLLFAVLSGGARDARRERRYLAQVDDTATAVMRAVGYDESRTAVGFHGVDGAGGDRLEPPIEALAVERVERGAAALVIVPLSVATDGIETLHALDSVTYQAARNAGAKQVRRAATPNADPRFIAVLAGLVRRALPVGP
jgi:ferrochelatase